MEASRTWDKERLLDMPKDKLVNLLFLFTRNIWSEDGLYFLGIEKKFGTDIAIEIDREVWSEMGKIEARRLKRFLEISGIPGNSINSLFYALKHTSWWLDNELKEFEQEDSYGTLTIKNCYVQMTRIKKGLGEFNCKSVRSGFLKSFAKEFNKDIQVNCIFCPPTGHPEDAWCRWEFKLRE